MDQGLATQLIVGLGNPGTQYEKTPHNAGANLLITLADHEGLSWKENKTFNALVAEWEIGGNRCRLLRPLSYMNDSGLPVSACLKFYKIAPEAILVVHDELDFPPGKARFKVGGGHGGHNGLRSIIAHCHSDAFSRLRLGIGHPGQAGAVKSYVLKRLRPESQSALEQSIQDSLEALPDWVAGDREAAQRELHKPEKSEGS